MGAYHIPGSPFSYASMKTFGDVALFAVVEYPVPVAVFPQQTDGVSVGNGRNDRIVQPRAAAKIQRAIAEGDHAVPGECTTGLPERNAEILRQRENNGSGNEPRFSVIQLASASLS